MFSHHSKGMWHNSVLCHIFISGIIWLPLALFVFSNFNVLNDSGSLFVFFTVLMFGLFLFRRAQTKLRFPEVEITNQHLILNRLMCTRAVYNLSEIKSPRFKFGILYFRHLGWPVIEPFHMPKEDKDEMLRLLSVGRQL